jgi:predicted Zn-dependent protease
MPARSYLPEVWARRAGLAHVESLTIDGLEAATAIARGRTDTGASDVRLVAIRGAETMYRFAFATPPSRTAAMAAELQRTAVSFRRLTADEARGLKLRTLRVVTVAPGDTVDSMAARMAFDEFRRERFQLLNGLSTSAQLAPGARVKIVIE